MKNINILHWDQFNFLIQQIFRGYLPTLGRVLSSEGTTGVQYGSYLWSAQSVEGEILQKHIW